MSPDVEWIIIDGGSEDGSEVFCKKHFDEIAYWISEADSGIYNAMNKGLRVARGEYLLFLNAGDCLTDEFKQADLRNCLTGEDMVWGDVVLEHSDGRHVLMEQPDIVSIDYFFTHSLCHQSVFFHRTLFVDDQYDESYRIAADLDFIIRQLFVNHCSFKHYALPVCVYDTWGGLSSQHYYDITRPERRRAIAQVLDGREEWFDAILLAKEIEDTKLYSQFLYLSTQQKLKGVVRFLLGNVIALYKSYLSIKRKI